MVLIQQQKMGLMELLALNDAVTWFFLLMNMSLNDGAFSPNKHHETKTTCNGSRKSLNMNC